MVTHKLIFLLFIYITFVSTIAIAEIGSITGKGLPPNFDEEPSAENDEEFETKTTTSGTDRPNLRQNLIPIPEKEVKKSEEEIDRKIEEMYKDSDYKDCNDELKPVQTSEASATNLSPNAKSLKLDFNITSDVLDDDSDSDSNSNLRKGQLDEANSGTEISAKLFNILLITTLFGTM